MKKTFLSFLCLAGSYMMFAQTTQNTDSLNRGTNTGTTTTTSTNSTTTDPTMNTNTGTNTNTNTNANSNWNSNTNVNATTTNTSDPTRNINTTTYNAYGTTSVAVPSTVSGYFERDYPGTSGVTWTQEGDFYHGTYMANGRYNHVYYNQSGATYRVSLPKAATWVPDDIISRVATAFGPMVYDVTTMRNAEGGNIYQVRVVENGQVKPHWFAEDGSIVMDPFRHDLNTEVNTGSYSGMDGTKNNVTTDNSGTTTTTTDSSMTTTTTTDNTNTSSNLNSGTTTTDSMNNTNNSGNNNNTDSGTTTGDLNTTSGTEVKEMKIKSKDGKTKIKTKTADGKETKTKIEDGEIKVKED